MPQAFRWCAVHPRLRGELLPEISAALPPAGSSPLARGTQRGIHSSPSERRFIPACAGNSKSWLRHIGNSPVHPRLRGELEIMTIRPKPRIGSSPLARGTHERQPQETQSERFIPACAGNSRRNTFFLLPRPVHPRLRGELRMLP